MVHNGIEYGDMQLIAEVYDILHRGLHQTPLQLSEIFSRWNEGVLESFLIEITAKIFSCRDDRSDGYLIDKILDAAEQKGTGKWTVISALELGVSIPTIASSVDARVLSSLKKERVLASEVLNCDSLNDCGSEGAFHITTNEVHDALYAAKILSYAQGLYLLRVASDARRWGLNLGTIAKIWRGGCIIRARFLDEISNAFNQTLEIPNLLLAPSMRTEVLRTVGSLRKVVAYGASVGIPVPALAASLAYFDSYRTARLPQNLTQAQRDFFGAHTFARIDVSGLFHMQW
jgi:6-phosphogluconate dehydrogenase